jgi:molybdate transport repressor ModE-like protein
MVRIDIRPVWRFRSETEKDFDFQLIGLLEALDDSGKLTQAARKAGISYRHAWNLIEQWQKFFGAPLVVMQRGRGTQVTALGSQLLWAGQRARARLEPELQNLASEFARALNETLSAATSTLVMHASHDFAVAGLRALAADRDLAIDIQYRGSFDALAALRRGECGMAGFHVPEGHLGRLMSQRYLECLPGGEFRVIRFVSRKQGFIVRPGNPKAIHSAADLTRDDVRLANRQRGSGTRALLEFLLSSEAIDRSRIRGYDTEEATHSAVAALIAGGQADTGFGVQAAAAQYRLDFVPYCNERYYLAFHTGALDTPAINGLAAILRGREFAELVQSLPGYSGSEAGEISTTAEALSEPRTGAIA